MLQYFVPISFFILVYAGIALFIVNKYVKWHNLKKNCILPVVASVIEIKKKRMRCGTGALVYKPIFQITLQGQKYLITSAHYSNLFDFHIGQQVPLRINPQNCNLFLYDEEKYNKGILLDIFACLLLLGFSTGLCIWFFLGA